MRFHFYVSEACSLFIVIHSSDLPFMHSDDSGSEIWSSPVAPSVTHKPWETSWNSASKGKPHLYVQRSNAR